MLLKTSNMHLIALPTELIFGISKNLDPKDILALAMASSRLCGCLIEELYRIARVHRLQSCQSLSNSLRDVSFWHDKQGNGTVLEWAAVNNRLSTFKRLLLDPEIDATQPDSYDLTLLHRLSSQGKAEYMAPLIHRLQAQGVDPFQTDKARLTPLHFAAGRGMLEAVELLIASGADVNAKDHHGNTPMHLAACTGSLAVFSALVQAGADVNSETRFGWAAIDQADITHHYDAVEKLIALGSRGARWQQKTHARNEYVRLSPCPIEYYFNNVDFSQEF